MRGLNFRKGFFIIIVSIFVIELGIMLVLQKFNPTIELGDTLIDSTLLILIFMPVIYFAIYLPLKREKEDALEAVKQKSLFLAKMSHEIRTPLNTILGISDYLFHEPHSQKYSQHLTTIYRTGNHLLEVVNEVLDYSKIESGQYSIENKEFDLQMLLNSIFEQYVYVAKKKNIVMSIEMKGIEQFAKGDKKCITQILHNGFSNAIKFTPASGQIMFKVFKSEDIESKDIVFQIIDSGPGIPKSMEEKVFQNYQQVDGTSERFGGTGLGLAIAKNLTELMAGTISLKSNQNSKGSTFTLTLPLLLSKDATLNIQDSETIEIKNPVRILLADDSLDNRFVIRLYLSKINCTLDEVSNGAEALELFQKNRYHMVFMDSEMPVMNGAESIKNMRLYESENTMPSTPIVALSGHSSLEEIEKMNEAGCSIYLMKPIRKNQLLEVIGDFCEPKEKFIEWQKRFSVNIKFIDSQHHVLVNLINDLYDAILKGQTYSQIGEILDRVVAYSDKHFSDEEDMLRKYEYSNFDHHKDGHSIFVNQISYYKEKFQKDPFSVSLGLLHYLKHWLLKHILEEDMQYSQEIGKLIK